MILTYKKKREILKIFIISLIALTSNALEFCFKKGPLIHQTRLEIKEYLIEGESIKIISNRHCLELKLRPDRLDFISKIIRAQFGHRLEKSSALPVIVDYCKFKLKETTKLQEKVSESVSELITSMGHGLDIELGTKKFTMICHKKAGEYMLDLKEHNKRKSLVSLNLELNKWFDLSAVSNLEGKSYSLMVIE